MPNYFYAGNETERLCKLLVTTGPDIENNMANRSIERIVLQMYEESNLMNLSTFIRVFKGNKDCNGSQSTLCDWTKLKQNSSSLFDHNCIFDAEPVVTLCFSYADTESESILMGQSNGPSIKLTLTFSNSTNFEDSITTPPVTTLGSTTDAMKESILPVDGNLNNDVLDHTSPTTSLSKNFDDSTTAAVATTPSTIDFDQSFMNKTLNQSIHLCEKNLTSLNQNQKECSILSCLKKIFDEINSTNSSNETVNEAEFCLVLDYIQKAIDVNKTLEDRTANDIMEVMGQLLPLNTPYPTNPVEKYMDGLTNIAKKAGANYSYKGDKVSLMNTATNCSSKQPMYVTITSNKQITRNDQDPGDPGDYFAYITYNPSEICEMTKADARATDEVRSSFSSMAKNALMTKGSECYSSGDVMISIMVPLGNKNGLKMQFKLPDDMDNQRFFGEKRMTYSVGKYENKMGWEPTATETNNKLAITLTVKKAMNEFTPFSLLVNGHRDRLSCDAALGRTSTICCSLSCICLLLVIICKIKTMIELRKLRKPMETSNELMPLELLLVLFIFFLVFVLFANQNLCNIPKEMCDMVGGLLYFLLLCQICWTGLMGLKWIQGFIFIFGSNKILKLLENRPYSDACCFGIPFFVLLISFGASGSKFIRNDGFCWVNPQVSLFGIVVPFSILMLTNIVLASLISYQICRTPTEIQQRLTSQQKKGRIYRNFMVVTFMLILFGSGWILQFLTFVNKIELDYLFTLVNSLHGVWIAAIYFSQNVLRDKKRKFNVTQMTTTTTTSSRQ